MWPQETVTRGCLLQMYSHGAKENKEDFPRGQSQGQRRKTPLPKHKGLILTLTVQQDVIRAVCFPSVLSQMGVF